MLPKRVNTAETTDFISGPTKVPGVRVYTQVAGQPETGEHVFYSRRREGPYYRWQETSGRWRAARVIEPAAISHTLSLATWKNVPEALMTRLGEHYLE